MASTKEEQRRAASESRAIDRTIEETKDTAKKVIREVRRELPESTATFQDFQEENLNAIKDITNAYLDSQKEVAKSLQAAERPYNNNIFTAVFWPYWANPLTFAENYVRAATNFADTTVAAARLSNDLVLEAMEFTRNSVEYARRNAIGVAKLNVENAKALETMSQRFAQAE